MSFLRAGRASLLVLIGTGAALAGPPPKPQTLYTTPPPATGALGLISRTQGTGPFAYTYRRVADNFTLTADAQLNQITWWGGTETSDGQLSNITSFTIEFFENSPNPGVGPGASVYSFTVTRTDAQPTLVIPPQTVGLLNAPMYQFTTFLPTPQVLSAGTTYWVSIAATLAVAPDANHEAWAWSSGTNATGDTLIAQDRFDGQGFLLRTLTARNAAFTLTGFPTPPPYCPGDTNNDQVVDSADLSVVLANFGTSGIPGLGAPGFGDFNIDGHCDIADLSVLLAQFGNSCP